ncbi:hypothetical protein, partial [Sansalvadorimonas verongulae]|uniref:hypothetical protein n=1 Tax=Sansalvadorimonas verongulae TaxID=2172824 RepID=UPI0038B60C64
GDGEHGWLTRAEVDALFALSEQAGKKMALTLPGGRSFTVIFDRADGPPIEAQQLFPLSAPTDGAIYTVVMRLLTV